MRVLIVANGRLESIDQLEWALGRTDYWIAVDGGVKHFLKAGQKPHRWMGDMDSYENIDIPSGRSGDNTIDSDAVDSNTWLTDVTRETFSAQKDMSDSELAIEKAVELGATEIVLMGMLGGRVDHTLFNLSLLMALHRRGIRGDIYAGDEWLMGIGKPGQHQRSFTGLVGSTMSLFPMTDMFGIDLVGFKYPLVKANMAMGDTLCLSNEVIEQEVVITVETGQGLIAFSNLKQ